MNQTLTRVGKIAVGAGAVGAGILGPGQPALADSGVIYSSGSDCSGRFLSNGARFQLRDHEGGGDDDYCYIDYANNIDLNNDKRVSIPEDSDIGNWQTASGYPHDWTGIGVTSLYFQVCEERDDDPDECSSVHGPYDRTDTSTSSK